jgi:hypothetical protein
MDASSRRPLDRDPRFFAPKIMSNRVFFVVNTGRQRKSSPPAAAVGYDHGRGLAAGYSQALLREPDRFKDCALPCAIGANDVRVRYQLGAHTIKSSKSNELSKLDHR